LLRVYAASDELDALTYNFRQSGFSNSIDDRHVVQLDDASARVALAASFSPQRTELDRPRTYQATLERPSLLVRKIGNGDS
jgi:hypothetical protein